MTRVSQSIQSLLTSNFREERRGAAVKESLSIKMTGVSTTRVTSSIHWKITSAKCNFRCLAITRVCNQGGWDATWQIHLLIHQDVVPKLWGFINEDTSDFCSAKHHILVFTLIWVSSKEKTAVPFKTWVWVTCKKRSSGEGRERAKGKGQRIQRQRTKPFLPVKKHSLWNSAFTSLARAVRHGCSWDLRATSHLCSLYSQGRQRERGRSIIQCYTFQYSSHWPQLAIKHLKYGESKLNCSEKMDFKDLVLQKRDDVNYFKKSMHVEMLILCISWIK